MVDTYCDSKISPDEVNDKISVSVIVPCVVTHNLDAHTGIPFLPHMAAYLAGALDDFGYDVQVIDCFGLQPHQYQLVDEFMFLGVNEQWVASHINKDAKVAFVYCRTVEDLISVERIILEIKRQRPQMRICLFENIQTVNSFSLKHLAEYLFKFEIDVAILGEPERRCDQVIKALLGGGLLKDIPGIFFKENGLLSETQKGPFDQDLDSLPLPLWEKFPLDGYWMIGYAHAPVKKNTKFLPLLTSRGCPFQCTFCIAPEVNPRWRGRSAVNVVDEIEYFYKKLQITDFHVSDLNPTVSEQRTVEICQELIARKLPITWKLAQGTKIETIKNEGTLKLMAEAGCTFMAISPESGSARLLKIMKKPFDLKYGLHMASKINAAGIRLQGCFVIGIPGENEEDRKLTLEYVKKLIKAGLDEIAVYIITPLPGAAIAKNIVGFDHPSQCTRSPTWRKDYKTINHFRIKLYMTFFMYKLLHHSGKVIREIFNLVTGNFETKMEMSLFKQVKLYLIRYLPFLFKRLNPEEKLLELASVKRSHVNISS